MIPLLEGGPRPPLRTAYAPDAPLPVRSWLRNPAVRFVAFAVTTGLLMWIFLSLAGQLPGGLPDWCYAGLQILATLAAYLLVTVLLEGRPRPWELDLRRLGGLGGGLLLGAGLCLVAFAVVWACGWRRVDGVGVPPGFWGWVFVLGAAAGITEEIIFRGILFRLVEQGLGTWGATAVSAVVFGAVHLSNPQATLFGAVAIALEAGVVFALLYALTRSLWVVMGVHAAWNVVQGPVLGFAVSGATGNGDGLLRTFPVGPQWLSGGEFGLEATPVAVLLWVAVNLWLARELVRRGDVVPPAWRRRRMLEARTSGARPLS